MNKNPKESTDYPPGEEANISSSDIGKLNKLAAASSSSTATNTSSTPWLRLKDPRIVRMSRVFGGKDRHSKVCTVRGLRDRRVRLSVPTAVQLYDLQDRLGLNQPSKVVDWLLNAAKDEIDELPPLPMPLSGRFSLLMAPRPEANSSTSNANQCNEEGFKNSTENFDQWEFGSSRLPRSTFWSTSSTTTSSDNALWRAKSKEVVARETTSDEKEDWRSGRNNNTINEAGKQEGNDHGQVTTLTTTNNLLQRTNNATTNYPFFPAGMLNNAMTNGYRWEPPTFPLSFLGGGNHGFTSQTDHVHNLNVVSLQPSPLSLSTHGSQFLVCPPVPHGTTQTYFPTTTTPTTTTTTTTTATASNSHHVEIHEYPRQVNHFQMLSSNNNPQNLFLPNSLQHNAHDQSMVRPFHFSTSGSNKLVHYSTTDSGGSQQNKEQADQFSSE